MQTQHSGASKKNADYEHAGVAIAVHKRLIKTVEEVREISGRNITAILDTGSGKTSFTATYGPTAEASEKTKTYIGRNCPEKWNITETASK